MQHLTCFAALCILTWSTVGQAAKVLDVKTAGSEQSEFEFAPPLWQTFTFTKAGALERIGAQPRHGKILGSGIGYDDEPVDMDLYRVGANGLPDGEAIATLSFGVDHLEGPTRIVDVSDLYFAVQPGDRLGLQSEKAEGFFDVFSFSIFEAGEYEGGQLYVGDDSTPHNWSVYPGGKADLLLRVWIDDGPLPGDTNVDGTIDLTDFGILKSNFGRSPAAGAEGDINADAKVDLADFGILKQNFGKSGLSSPMEPVPEPATALLALMGATSLALGGRQAIMRFVVNSNWPGDCFPKR